jgi:4-carboxymuconolactone decarboxylase
VPIADVPLSPIVTRNAPVREKKGIMAILDDRDDERYAVGRDVFVRMWGEEGISRFEANIEAVSPDLLSFIMEFVAGDVWTRNAIDAKTRSLVTIAVLGTLGRSRQLGEHVEGAISNGATEEEIVETLLHLSAYAGFPAAWDSLEVARRVFRTRHRRPRKS